MNRVMVNGSKSITHVFFIIVIGFYQTLVFSDEKPHPIKHDDIKKIIMSQNIETKPKQLTLQEAILLSMQNNPELEMAFEREKQAGYGIAAANSRFYPKIELKSQAGQRYLNPHPNNTEGGGGNSTEGNAALQIRQLLFDGFASISEAKRSQIIKESSEIETDILIESIITETIQYYFDILRYQKTIEDATSFIHEMQGIMKKITLMQSSGAASMIELDFTKARLASARSATANAKSSLNEAISNLEFLVNDLPEFNVIEPRDIESYSLKNLKTYIQLSQKHNKQALLNHSGKKALRKKINAEKGKYFPTLNLIVEGKYSKNEAGASGSKMDASVLLTASILLFDAGSRRAAINKSTSQLQELKISDRLFMKELKKDVKLAYNQVYSIKQTLISTKEEIRANKKLQSLNRQNLELGEIKIIELIEVEERLFNSKANKHQQVSNLFVNYYHLMIKSGLVEKAILSPIDTPEAEETSPPLPEAT